MRSIYLPPFAQRREVVPQLESLILEGDSLDRYYPVICSNQINIILMQTDYKFGCFADNTLLDLKAATAAWTKMTYNYL